MYEKGIAVIAVTRRGVETALKIQKTLDIARVPCTVYAPHKYSQNGVVAIDKKLTEFIKDIYSKVDGLVAVMATGIIIRSVAPLLESKLTDPAVVSVDAAGKFAISLLSGHLGGANDLAHIVAKGINAIPVVTTATDSVGKLSVEEFAKALHLIIQNPDSLVGVNSAIVNGDRLVLVLVGDAKIPPNALAGYEVKLAENGVEALDIINSSYDAGVIISHEPLTITKFVKPFAILKTRQVVVGLGARKDASMDAIIEAVDTALEQVHVPLARVYRFATVDIKQDSLPMLDAVKKLGAPLEFLSVEALRAVDSSELSPDSAMVQEKIGVGGVCERAAILIAGKNAKLILKKTKRNGVTVAIAEGE
ncbi:MAG: cobalamin biosynthesis protein [Candidatus Bathyarchaeota archaeon]|nr:cobalamin biosynthesis protein [Candidatus Bathyarchaeota archaeon]